LEGGGAGGGETIFEPKLAKNVKRFTVESGFLWLITIKNHGEVIPLWLVPGHYIDRHEGLEDFPATVLR
jgi:hypothetical protein